MNEPICEEGEVLLYVCPSANANRTLAAYFGQDAEEQMVSKRCDDHKTRSMWLIDIELLRRLDTVRPRLQFDVYRQVGSSKPKKVALHYALQGNTVKSDGKPKANDPNHFPVSEDKETPF